MKAKGVPLEEVTARLPPERRARVEAMAAELIAQHAALRDVRRAMGKTQAAVARRLGITPENVGRIERRGDMLLSTLRGYVRALGGDVHLTVELPGHAPVRLEGLGDLAPERPARGTPKAKPARRGAPSASRARPSPKRAGSGRAAVAR